MDSPLVSTSGHLPMPTMKIAQMNMCAPAQDLTSPTLELYLPSLVKTTSVKLELNK